MLANKGIHKKSTKLLTMLITVLITLYQDFIIFLIPKRCIHCGQILQHNSHYLCVVCLSKLYEISYADGQRILLDNFGYSFEIKSAFFLYPFMKNGRVQSLIHALKYQNQQQIGVDLGRQIGRKIRCESTALPEVILAVPLHPSRKKQRGYNQAHCIAVGIQMELQLDIATELLRRVRNTATQTKKNRHQRWKNLDGGFEINTTIQSRYEGKHFLIVDDVFTTGATVEAVLNCLGQLKDIQVSLAAVAYAREAWE